MADYNDDDFVCLNPDMYDLMDNLKVANKALPYKQQLPDVLFLALTWAIYNWRQAAAEAADSDHEGQMTVLEIWREKSGYNDLHLIKDRFSHYLSAEQHRVIAAFESWGCDSHFFDYLESIYKERAGRNG